MNPTKWVYACSSCGKLFPLEKGRYLCPECGPKSIPARPLEGILEAVWEGEAPTGRVPLPVEAKWFPPLAVGNTPLRAAPRLAAELGVPALYLKDDGAEPSGSFKDRASALVAAFARREGIGEIVLASTGNAASSMSCMGAAAGLAVTVFVPAKAPVAKRVQVLQYGATMIPVDGSYDLAYEKSLEYSLDPVRAPRVMSRNTAYNPLTIEGKKTVAFELLEELELAESFGAGKKAAGARLHVFVPTGDGAILCGVYKGFEDLVRLGRLDRVPTIWACQADGSSAIFRALRDGGFGESVPSDTVADSIAVDAPRAGILALKKLQHHAGRALALPDSEILAAQRLASSRAGVFMEPSSAAAMAAFIRVAKDLPPDALPVVLATGSGLKDVRSAARAVGLGAD
ncbi:MAG: pyridoxal-phosphate dependent enzyme [Spirochaetales bacterium]|nr:pyridoxal-phosphate dependent enzyme [Spirochaetales bacterium]